MKYEIFKTNLFRFNLLIFAAVLLHGCGKREDPVIKTTVTGKIENPGDYLVEFDLNDTIIIVDLEEDNTFKFETTLLNEPKEVEFVHGKESVFLYLVPGTNLNFNIDYNLLYQSAEFAGQTAAENKYLFKKATLERALSDKNTLYRLPEKEYLNYIEKIKQDKMQLFSDMKSEIRDSVFTAASEGNIYYEWANNLISYGNMHAMLTKDFNFEISDSLKTLIKSIPLENPSMMSSYRYINFVFDHITQKVNESMAAVSVSADDVNQVMLGKSIETTQQLLDDELLKKRIIKEFVDQYYPGLDKSAASELLLDYQQYMGEDVINMLKNASLKSNTES